MFQVYSAATLAILALSHNTEAVLTAAIDKSNCEPIEKLGTSNLNRYDYSTTFDVDKDCMYTLEINMKQDESLPIPTNADQCNPAVEFPPIASDGLPYFAFRWAYESVSKKVKAATGIDHISVDFNPCGHPPMHVFTRVHYDLHIYLKDPDYRRCMTCDTITGTSVCNPTGQTTPSGRGFFNVNTIFGTDAEKLANMPNGFQIGLYDMVPLMGGHAWDFDTQPASSNEWVDPIWIMGPYDGTIVDYEPMIPLSFMTGNADKFYEEELTYVGQSITALPMKYSVAYDASTGFTKVVLEGKSNVCNKKRGKKSSKSSKKTRYVRAV